MGLSEKKNIIVVDYENGWFLVTSLSTTNAVLGFCRLQVHRVRVPDAEARRRAPRRSLAFFVEPDDDVVVAPLDGSSKYPPFLFADHFQHRISQSLNS